MTTKSPKLGEIIVYFIVWMALSWCILNLLSCYTPKKAEKQISKALEHYPNKVATIARNAFPCTTNKSDTTIVYTDTLIQIDCPDNKEYLTVHDTVLSKIIDTKTIKVPVTIPQKIVTIIKKVEDSAKIYLLNSQVMNLQGDTTQLNAIINYQSQEIASIKKQKGGWITFSFILIFLIVGYVAGRIKKMIP